MNRIKELRKEKGLTQKELAKILGVTSLSVLRWENGERQVKTDRAMELADFFEVPVGYLLGYEEPDEYMQVRYMDLMDDYNDLLDELEYKESTIQKLRRQIRRLENENWKYRSGQFRR